METQKVYNNNTFLDDGTGILKGSGGGLVGRKSLKNNGKSKIWLRHAGVENKSNFKEGTCTKIKNTT